MRELLNCLNEWRIGRIFHKLVSIECMNMKVIESTRKELSSIADILSNGVTVFTYWSYRHY